MPDRRRIVGHVTEPPVQVAQRLRARERVVVNVDTLAAAHSAAKAIKLDSALSGMPVPLHPGAARYFKEKGLNVPQ